MDRINKQGAELIAYKIEWHKDYPDIVKNSLTIALEQLVANNVLDVDTYMNLKNETFTVSDFRGYLLSKPSYSKTEEELFQEFEVLRQQLDKKMEDYGILDLKSESIVDKNSILLTKKFCIDEKFTMAYFGVEEKDLLKLMKRRGFIEKFAVLRLTAIFNQFKPQYDNDLFQTEPSLVYFDKDENGYSVDYNFEIKIEEIEQPIRLEQIAGEIKRIKEEAEALYLEKTVI